MEYGLIGEKLGHSFSKELHSKISDYDYQVKEISSSELAPFITSKDFKGINVTIPYKTDVMKYLDFISAEAKSIGAVNTIVNDGGKLYGYNTDYFGIKALLKKANICVKDKSVYILGTGGTSKTAKAVVKDLGAKNITVVSRNKAGEIIDYEELKNQANTVQVLINATPIGMFPKTEFSPVNLDYFVSLEGVIDAVYNPLKTSLIMQAEKRKINCLGGLYMLVAQGVYASAQFTFSKPNLSLIDKIYNQILSEKQNIVLTGMPSCGKSSVGKILSKLTGREFVDTDEVITKKECAPSVIIKEKGEAYFRNLESEVIKELSKGNGKIIATGGGAILRGENADALKQNGVIFFIDRALNSLITTADRPLSSSKEKLEKLYSERYDIYKNNCDYQVNGNLTLEQVASAILKEFLL